MIISYDAASGDFETLIAALTSPERVCTGARLEKTWSMKELIQKLYESKSLDESEQILSVLKNELWHYSSCVLIRDNNYFELFCLLHELARFFILGEERAGVFKRAYEWHSTIPQEPLLSLGAAWHLRNSDSEESLRLVCEVYTSGVRNALVGQISKIISQGKFLALSEDQRFYLLSILSHNVFSSGQAELGYCLMQEAFSQIELSQSQSSRVNSVDSSRNYGQESQLDFLRNATGFFVYPTGKTGSFYVSCGVNTGDLLLCAHSLLSAFENCGMSRTVVPIATIVEEISNSEAINPLFVHQLPRIRGLIKPLGIPKLDGFDLMFPWVDRVYEVEWAVTYFNLEEDVALLRLVNAPLEIAQQLYRHRANLASEVNDYEEVSFVSYPDSIHIAWQEWECPPIVRRVTWTGTSLKRAHGQTIFLGQGLRGESGAPLFNAQGEVISIFSKSFMSEGKNGDSAPLGICLAAPHEAVLRAANISRRIT